MDSYLNDNQESYLVVKQYEFDNPNKDDINYIINNSLKNCADKYFHTFTYQCKYIIKFVNMENNEEIILDIIINDRCKNQNKEICRKIRNAKKNNFKFVEIVKLTIEIYSNWENININYMLKLKITNVL